MESQGAVVEIFPYELGQPFKGSQNIISSLHKKTVLSSRWCKQMQQKVLRGRHCNNIVEILK